MLQTFKFRATVQACFCDSCLCASMPSSSAWQVTYAELQPSYLICTREMGCRSMRHAWQTLIQQHPYEAT